MRKLALFLALLIGLTALGGLAMAAEAPMELEFVDRTGSYEWDTTPLFTHLEEKFNVKITRKAYAAGTEGSTWYALAILSGDMPAYIADLTPDEYANYARQGLFRALDLDMIKEKAPQMMDWWTTEYVENVFDFARVDGTIYAVPVYWSLTNRWNTVAIREDLLEKLGQEVPQTLDELSDVMAKAKAELDLDYMMTGSAVGNLQFALGAYDVYRGIWYQGEDGELYWWTYHPNAKMAVANLADWYQKGYIDPEFITNDGAMVTDRVTSGRTLLAISYWPDFCAKDSWGGGGGALRLALEERTPGAKLANLGALPTGYGKGGWSASPFTGWFAFSSHLTDEQVAKYLEIFNYVSQNYEPLEMGGKGIEGVHFTKDENFKYTWLEPADTDDKRAELGLGVNFPENFNNYTVQYPFFTSKDSEADRHYWEDPNFTKPNLLGAVPRALWSEYGTSFRDYCDKNLIDFITGTRSMDDWDSFINELNTQYHGEELVKEAKDTLAQYTTVTDKFAK